MTECTGNLRHWQRGAVMGLTLAISGAVAPQLAAQSEDGDVMDPYAMEIASQAVEFLASQPQMAVDWFVSYDVVVDGREKLTQTRHGRNELKRGEGFYAYVEQGLNTRQYFYDFSRFTVYDVQDNAYATTPFRGRFRELTERIANEYDVRLPIWTLMSADPNVELLDSVQAIAYVGLTRIAGQSVHHLAMSDYHSDWQMWITDTPDQPEIVMLVGTNPYEKGWPQYRAYFSNWDFDAQIDADRFDFTPNDSANPMYWPKINSRVNRDTGAGQ